MKSPNYFSQNGLKMAAFLQIRCYHTQQIFTIHLHFHRKGWLSQAVCSKFSRCLPEAAARPLSLSLRPARLAILTGRCQDEEVRKAIAVSQHGNTNSTPWEEKTFCEILLNWYIWYIIFICIFLYIWTIKQVLTSIEDCDHETLSVKISMISNVTSRVKRYVHFETSKTSWNIQWWDRIGWRFWDLPGQQIDRWRVPILGSQHLSSCKLIIFYFSWVNMLDSPELGFDLM